MANDTNYIGVAMGLDVTDLKAGISEANKQIQLANSAFKAASSGMDDWTKSTEGLQAKIKQLDTVLSAQKSKLAGLEAEYAKVAAEQGENSEAARKLQVQINNQKAVVNTTQKEFDNYTETLAQAESGSLDLEDATLKAGKAVDKAGDSAKEAGGKFEGLKSIGGAVAGGIAAIGAAAVGVVGGFLSLAESTRESRNEMAKLDTAFQTAGLSADAAKSTFTTLYGVMGDEGAAVEAGQQLAKISKDEDDLTANTRILTGVMAEYGNSIPLEGLAEGMAATASMGSVQGALADALEWQGVNLDDFNAKLATMATEEERAAYIQETLTGLYGESADAYRENNAEVIAAQEAQANLNSVLNELGAIAEPIMTTIKTLAAEVLTAITPFVSLIGEGLTGALNGSAGATDLFAEGMTGIVTTITESVMGLLPSLLNVITTIVPQLVTALLAQLPTLLETIISMVTQLISAISEMLPTIVAAIMEILPQLINSLIAAIPQLLEAAITLLMAIVDAIPTIITALIEALPTIIQTLIDALITAIPMLLEAAIQLLNTLVEAIPTIIQSLVENLPTIIETIINGLIEAIPLLLEGAITFLMAIIDAIPVIVTELVNNLPEIITTIITALVNAFPQLLSTAGELFGQLLTAAWDLITKLPEVLGSIISTIVDFLVSPFKDLFGGMWESLTSGASDAWQGVKDVFGAVVGFFSDIFGNAWQAVKDVFSTGGEIFAGITDGIFDAFKTVVNAIIGGINDVIAVPFNAINGVLTKLKSIDIMGLKPFDWIKTFTVPQIPELEEGGILEKGQVGLLEGKGDEAVIPLERNLDWIKNIAKQLAKHLSFDVTGVKNGLSAISRNAINGTNSNNTTSKNTVINAQQTVHYNGNLSRKQLKQLENDNYTAIKLRLQAEGAI